MSAAGPGPYDVVKELPHGAKVRIFCGGGLPCIYHESTVEPVSSTPVTSYPDGMVVGCTFLTNDAIDLILKYRHEYQNRKAYVKHQ